MISPAGISSEASSGGKKFYVQTEFAPRPKPRITTSVSLNGEVVQKVENLWQKLPQSEEDKEEIERYLRKQHQEVIRDIEKKGQKFASPKEEAQKSATDEEKQRKRVILQIKEVISGSRGVAEWVLFSKDDQIVGQDVLNAKGQSMVRLARCGKDLASFLSSVSKVGNLVGGIVEGKDMMVVLIPIKDDFFAVRVNPDVDVKNLVQKIRAAVFSNPIGRTSSHIVVA